MHSFVVAMIWIAVPLWRVDAEKGRINAKNFVHREKPTDICSNLLAAIICTSMATSFHKR